MGSWIGSKLGLLEYYTYSNFQWDGVVLFLQIMINFFFQLRGEFLVGFGGDAVVLTVHFPNWCLFFNSSCLLMESYSIWDISNSLRWVLKGFINWAWSIEAYNFTNKTSCRKFPKLRKEHCLLFMSKWRPFLASAMARLLLPAHTKNQVQEQWDWHFCGS